MADIITTIIGNWTSLNTIVYAVGLYGQYCVPVSEKNFKLFDLEIHPTTQITGKIYLFKLLIS
jgi:uncharacterized membrane protein YuzA (DUF378 family)